MNGPTVYLNDTSNYGVSHPFISIRILMPRLGISMLTLSLNNTALCMTPFALPALHLLNHPISWIYSLLDY